MKSIHRVAKVLEVLSLNPEGLSFTDINNKLDLPKSSLNNILNTLTEVKMVQFNDSLKNYTLGSKLWELATTYHNNLSILKIAQPYLEKIRDEKDVTLQIAVLVGKDVMYIGKYSSNHPIQLSSNVGTKLPAYATGLGKSMLACLPQNQLLNLYPDSEFERFTKNTITTKEELIKEIMEVRKRGYAIDSGEYSSKIRCIAVPIIGFDNECIAAISCSVLNEPNMYEKEMDLIQSLIDSSRELSELSGAIDPDYWRKVN